MRSCSNGIRRVAWLLCQVLAFVSTTSGDVIRQTVTFPPGALAGWPSVDFDGDGTHELSFDLYALGHESGGVMFLDVHGSSSTEVLLQDWRVLPLQSGDRVSLTPVVGQWQPTGLQNCVWTLSYTSFPEVPPPTPAQGVGMPGYGDFMGVRFREGSDWHYGWVRFGVLGVSSPPLPQPGWPSVLEYAYETLPNTPILVPEPSTCALLLSSCLVIWFYGRSKRMG